MSNRDRWITWILAAIAAIAAAIAAGRPITIPPPPLGQTPPPQAPPPAPEPPQPNPLAAIVRISRSGVGCSATIIGPRRSDGRYWVLSAAHCSQGLRERWTATTRDGRSFGLTVVALDRRSDVAWMLTDNPGETFSLPFAILAEQAAPAGTAVWHAGFGIDRPGNREDGVVVSPRPDERGQIEYRLNVSSGDSGGAIIRADTGHVLGPVCCTTAPGQLARVWAAAPEVCRSLQSANTSLDDWEPLTLPLHPQRANGDR
jgi:S1-C subfamily serine protease